MSGLEGGTEPLLNFSDDITGLTDNDGEGVVEDSVDEDPHKGVLIVVVSLALLCDFVLLTIIIPFLPHYLHTLKISNTLVGLLFSSKAISQAVCNPFVGICVDRMGGRVALAIGMLVLCLSTVVFAVAETYLELLVARAIQGLASSSIVCGGMSLIAETHQADERGEAYGNVMGVGALGVMTGPVIGGVLYTSFGKTAPFLAVGGVLVVAMLAMAWVSRGGTGKTKASKASGTSRDIESNANGSSTGSRNSSFAVSNSLYCNPSVQLLFFSIFFSNAAIAMLEPVLQVCSTQERVSLLRACDFCSCCHLFLSATLMESFFSSSPANSSIFYYFCVYLAALHGILLRSQLHQEESLLASSPSLLCRWAHAPKNVVVFQFQTVGGRLDKIHSVGERRVFVSTDPSYQASERRMVW
jgi:MFS family permease